MIGALAQKAMIRHPITEEKMVANTLKSVGIPASFRISGLTIMMYEMAKKPVTPAISSLRTTSLCRKASLSVNLLAKSTCDCCLSIKIPIFRCTINRYTDFTGFATGRFHPFGWVSLPRRKVGTRTDWPVSRQSLTSLASNQSPARCLHSLCLVTRIAQEQRPWATVSLMLTWGDYFYQTNKPTIPADSKETRIPERSM